MSFNACSATQPSIHKNALQRDNEKIVLSAKNPLRYAHVDKNGVLITIDNNPNSEKNGKDEVIIISEYGFYPNYKNKMSFKIEEGKQFVQCCMNSSLQNKQEKEYCNSQFFKDKDAITTAIGGGISAVLSLGLTAVTGSIGSQPTFDKALFDQVVRDNNLVSVRKKLLLAKAKKEREVSEEREAKAKKEREVSEARKAKVKKEREAREARKAKVKKEREANAKRKRDVHNKVCKNIQNKIDVAAGSKLISLYNELDKYRCQSN